ncbi:DUF1475 domain-containing protein [Bdellovibrio sp. qaytius]|nr:DUF1475 domain-containing protein [Bdellovibrio sp. qaytius]
MKKSIVILFSLILLAMLAVTSWASSYESVIVATKRLVAEPWMVATLFDAYFGFLTFFVWVCYKESKFLNKVIWFVAIMILGNIAMSVYVLLEVHRLKDHFTMQKLLSEKI